ncbi:MAG: 6-phosphogluconolactonase [Myxococcales bacterium]
MDVVIVKDAEAVAEAAAEMFVEATAGAVAARGKATVALTGGSSAAPFFAGLRGPLRRKIPWDKIHFFFTDDRAVPPSHPESNYGLAQRELFSQVPVLDAQVHRMHGEANDLAEEAQRYAGVLRQYAGEPPRLDLVLLGIGPDGHICSLFAGRESSADRGDSELVRHVPAPDQVEPHLDRLTLTPFPVVTGRSVVLQVTSGKKAAVLEMALRGKEDLVACPAQWLRHGVGRVAVITVREAAPKLE